MVDILLSQKIYPMVFNVQSSCIQIIHGYLTLYLREVQQDFLASLLDGAQEVQDVKLLKCLQVVLSLSMLQQSEGINATLFQVI